MPDATITSTASTFGTITGTFTADQSTVTGTISGTVTGTLTGSVGVPGPAGPGVPAGGTAGQYLQKIDGVDYNTDWVTINLSAYAPLNSPVFTGDARAVTPTFGDNDTSIATTAFVQSALLGGTAVARNLEVEVRNQSGSTIPAGSIVYISGATGNKPLITLAQANNDANSAQTMGFTKTSIANNGTGYVIVRGELENIDTSALTEGVQLYLSPTVAGTWTITKPSAPQHLVYVGIVIRAHPTQGVILVAVQNGYELNELHDVAITSPTNGQVLKYNSTTNLWVNGTDSSGVAWGGITGSLSSQTDLQSALDGKYSTTNPAGYITSSALSPYLTSATAASTYQTLSGMSSYLTTTSAASTYYPFSNPAGYITSSALTPYAPLAGATFTGKVNFKAGTTSSASINLAPGVAPTSPLTGDVWFDSSSSKVVFRSSTLTQPIASELWVTSQGYLTSASLSGYATESWVTSNFYPLSGNPSNFATESWVT
ncbi:MAG: Nitrincola phage, partial [Verrucomicrobiota bacterium]